MVLLRLTCSSFWVDVRLREMNGRWIASADTPDGPSLGMGKGAIEAVEHALEPFDGIVDELLSSLPRAELTRRSGHRSMAATSRKAFSGSWSGQDSPTSGSTIYAMPLRP